MLKSVLKRFKAF